jgi:hypothetical protein
LDNRLLYLVGALIVAAAVGYGAHLLGAPLAWIGVGIALVLGFGVMGAAKKSSRDKT